MFCTYITFYRGNKLPPFYIGSSTIQKVNSGYRGTVSSKIYKDIWNFELLTNPQLFKTVILTTHHTRKEATEKENYFHHRLSVVKNPLYINRAYAIPNGFSDIDKKGKNNGMYNSKRFGKLNPMYGKKHSEESKNKMRKPKTITHPKSEEFKQLLSKKYKNKSFEERFGYEISEKIKAKLKGPKSTEQKRKQSEIMKSKPKLICPHCFKSCSAGNYSRWHGDSCRHKENLS